MQQQPFSVYIHPRAFWNARFGGVTRYVCELSSFLNGKGVDIQIPITDTPNEYLLGSALYENSKKITPSAPIWVKCIRRLLQHTKLSAKARRFELLFEALRYTKNAQYDIVHPSDTYSTEILEHIRNKPLVVTIHDMIDEVYYADSKGHQITSEKKKQFVKRADAIIAISEHTKKDLVRLFDVHPDKIDVIYHGNSLRLPENHAEINIALPERYILFVGTRIGYKNFATLAKAFSLVAKTDETLKLICVGGGSFSDEERQFLDDLGIKDKTEQRNVNDHELAVLYHRSECFVFPSEYEGFGMPILEAFECGAPVICAACSCFPEIAQGAALYFEKHNAAELAKCLTDVIYSPEAKQKLREAGKNRLAEFSWEKAATQTLAVYNRVLQSK